MPQILVVDDEIGIRELLSEILSDEGYEVHVAENATAAKIARNESRPDLVLLDIWMPDLDGISLLKEWNANGQLNMPVVMMSGHATIDTAVEATRFGAVDFLEKPIALQKLLSTVKHAMRHVTVNPKATLSLASLTRSLPIRELKKRLEQMARGSRIISLRGVYGGVAELCARTLQLPQTPWLDIAHLSAPINQEQLQKLQGGVVFVGDLAILGKMQQMNIGFVLDRLEKFNLTLVVGSSGSYAALEPVWDAAQLRRLGEVWLTMPELKRCQDDIPEIATLLLTYLVESGDVSTHQFSVGALNRLRQAVWPDDGGGWMLLFNTVRNLSLSSLEEEITEEEVLSILPQIEADSAGNDSEEMQIWLTLPMREARDAFEKRYFEALLKREKGNMTRVAEQAGLERTHLYRKLKQLGVVTGKRSED